MQLRVAQIVPDTEAEGPGRRLAVWVQGCSLRCPGCCNPEMFSADKGGSWVEVDALMAQLGDAEGLSVLGGEPFEQPAALAVLCAKVQAAGKSVMIYTGYTLAELRAKHDPAVDALLSTLDLLVDGRYEREHPEASRRWIGSSNQVMHFMTSRYTPADPRFSRSNTVELRFEKGQLLINGWPQAADALRRR